MRWSLKARCYANLARRNAWLLSCDAKVRNYARYRLTPHREVIDVRRAGPNLYDLPVEAVMNTAWWIETRRGLLATDGRLPDACVGCYTLDDPWRREM